MKRIVLCADDYGQSKAISQGIIDLIKIKRLSATSGMVNAAYWEEAAILLHPLQSEVTIGLHFNLTQGNALSKAYQDHYGYRFLPLSQLMRNAFLRQFDKKIIEQELMSQLDRFVECMGFLPKFIDGHQHIHQFPIIRDALISVYQQKLKGSHVAIRLVKQKIVINDVWLNAKKVIIHFTGVSALEKLLQMNDIPHNSSFSGVYDFSKAKNYREFFLNFLNEIDNEGMIMCHPGLQAEDDDEIKWARFYEYQYLMSSQFMEDCEELGVLIV